ncbi:transcriptional regulator, TetR family [Tistlia consotensis]|uniref:Transcriptional regulator, TetR family n=1 Tax=Tistlia consotensis USBA 355 TaxID=560819 RepID=A0A1Y6CEK6_9PROT|nr:TetR/AcrR family transcriptional regulator [Tistlia consotensis]SMF51270.1 transcriptional regulator, TetR family [Tistlia consotensis USBA 355]SNR84537.1 transcriptional regulator, TetR family [Tistlia consotensis]
MRVSRTQAAENRQAVINVASRLFREHGFDGIGLKDLMKGAGLTQGAFYKQFASKEDLAAQASRRALESATSRWAAAAAANPDDPLGAVIAFYLSPEHREEKMDGCPIVALGSDAARQSADVKASFEAGIKAHLEVLDRLIAGTDGKAPKGKAMAIASTMVGAMTLSRIVSDPDLAQAFLDAAAEQVREAVAACVDGPTLPSARTRSIGGHEASGGREARRNPAQRKK